MMDFLSWGLAGARVPASGPSFQGKTLAVDKAVMVAHKTEVVNKPIVVVDKSVVVSKSVMVGKSVMEERESMSTDHKRNLVWSNNVLKPISEWARGHQQPLQQILIRMLNSITTKEVVGLFIFFC